MKDFLAHVDAVTYYAEELLEALERGVEDKSFEDEVLVAGGLFGDLAFGHIRRLRVAIDSYHARYGRAEPDSVMRQSGDKRLGEAAKTPDLLAEIRSEQRHKPAIQAGKPSLRF